MFTAIFKPTLTSALMVGLLAAIAYGALALVAPAAHAQTTIKAPVPQSGPRFFVGPHIGKAPLQATASLVVRACDSYTIDWGEGDSAVSVSPSVAADTDCSTYVLRTAQNLFENTGTYKATLTTNGQTLTSTVEVKDASWVPSFAGATRLTPPNNVDPSDLVNTASGTAKEALLKQLQQIIERLRQLGVDI